MIIKVVIDTNDEKWKFNKMQQWNKVFQMFFCSVSLFLFLRWTIQQFKVWKSKYKKKDKASRKSFRFDSKRERGTREREGGWGRRRKGLSPRKDLRRQFVDYCKESCLVFALLSSLLCVASNLWQLFSTYFFFKLLLKIHQMWIGARVRRFKGTRDCLRCAREDLFHLNLSFFNETLN